MREILFRAKWITPIWLYGYCFLDFDNRWVIHWNENGESLASTVNPDTICEYTGLTDKSGNKVFEGDIFLNKFHNEPTNIGIVRYGEYCNAFNSDPYCSHIGFYVDWNDDLQIMRKDLGFWCKRREVVGNIFDNPKLIKKKGQTNATEII